MCVSSDTADIYQINQTQTHTLYYTCLSHLHINKLSNVTNTDDVVHMCVCACLHPSPASHYSKQGFQHRWRPL